MIVQAALESLRSSGSWELARESEKAIVVPVRAGGDRKVWRTKYPLAAEAAI
jgi:hypothetical protein